MGNNRADTLETYLRQRKDLVDEALDAFLPPEDTPPESIFKAVRYSIFAGGNGFAPFWPSRRRKSAAPGRRTFFRWPAPWR